MQYQVVFDIQQNWYTGWWISAIGIAIIALPIIVFYARTSMSKRMQFGPVVFGMLILGLGMMNFFSFIALRSAARNGNYEVVEGPVKQFVPGPFQGRKHPESFVVNNYRFSYEDNYSALGFSQTRKLGGPIKEGLQVRIAHVEGTIIKLEIAR